MVIDTPMENVMLQGYEVDLWNEFWFFVRNGYACGEGVYRQWNQIGYGVSEILKIKITKKEIFISQFVIFISIFSYICFLGGGRADGFAIAVTDDEVY